MERIYSYLPDNINSIVRKLPRELKESVAEVRLRKDALISLTTYTKNLFLTRDGKVSTKKENAVTCNAEDINFVVRRLCEGSVYRYMQGINSGYIVTESGVRVGVCGEAMYEKKELTGVSSFSSLNIRLPHDFDSSGDKISEYISRKKNASVLIMSPSGYGKTTVIRSIAKALSEGKFSHPLRVSLIDDRAEILPYGSKGLLDRFVGYSKPDGIEIAVRLFNPEYIICDEIGLFDDTQAILSVQNSGVPFIATTHAKGLDEALLRPNIKELITHRVFDTFVRLEKGENGVTSVFEEIKE